LSKVKTAILERISDRTANGFDISVSSEFADESPSCTKCPPDTLDNPLWLLDPVKGGIAEYRIELFGEVEALRVHNPDIKAALPSGLDLLGTRVYANDTGTSRDERLAKPAVAATNVENALARARFEQFDYFKPIFRHESGISLIKTGIPVLGHRETGNLTIQLIGPEPIDSEQRRWAHGRC
jgi:hypothetical protein